MKNMLKVTDTCRVCDFTITHSGDDIILMMRQIDAAHAALNPECPEIEKRKTS